MSQYCQVIQLEDFQFVPGIDELDIWIKYGSKTVGNIRFCFQAKIRGSKFEDFNPCYLTELEESKS